MASISAITNREDQDNLWYVYIIECKNQMLYTGITNDLARRFDEHQNQGPKCAKFLRGKAPLILRYAEIAEDRSSASKRELAIKKMQKAAKLALIEQGVDIPPKNI